MIYEELNVIKTGNSSSGSKQNEPGIDLNANNLSKMPFF